MRAEVSGPKGGTFVPDVKWVMLDTESGVSLTITPACVEVSHYIITSVSGEISETERVFCNLSDLLEIIKKGRQ